MDALCMQYQWLVPWIIHPLSICPFFLQITQIFISPLVKYHFWLVEALQSILPMACAQGLSLKGMIESMVTITWRPQSLGYQVSLSKTWLIFVNHTHFLIITKCCYLIPRYRECQHLPPILEACNHLPLLSFPTNLPRVTNHIE